MPLPRLPLLALVLLLQGCCAISFSSRQHIDVAPLDAEEIRVTTGDLDRPYDEIAILSVGPREDDEVDKIFADLRQAARNVNADAVVRVDVEVYGSGEDGYARLRATGTAVRFR